MKNNISYLLRYSTPNLGDETSPITIIILTVVLITIIPLLFLYISGNLPRIFTRKISLNLKKDKDIMMKIFLEHSLVAFGEIEQIQTRKYSEKTTVSIIDKKTKNGDELIFMFDISFSHKNQIFKYRIETSNTKFEKLVVGDKIEIAYIPEYFECIIGEIKVDKFLSLIGLKKEIFSPNYADIKILDLNKYPMAAANCDINYDMFN